MSYRINLILVVLKSFQSLNMLLVEFNLNPHEEQNKWTHCYIVKNDFLYWLSLVLFNMFSCFIFTCNLIYLPIVIHLNDFSHTERTFVCLYVYSVQLIKNKWCLLLKWMELPFHFIVRESLTCLWCFNICIIIQRHVERIISLLVENWNVNNKILVKYCLYVSFL